MSTTLSDIYYEDYITNLFSNLNGLLPEDARSEFLEIISAILNIHIYIKSKIAKFIIEKLKINFALENSTKISKIINNLRFSSKVELLQSLELADQFVITYCKQLNNVRNDIAHDEDIENIKFFDKNIFTVECFELLQNQTEKILKLLKVC